MIPRYQLETLSRTVYPTIRLDDEDGYEVGIPNSGLSGSIVTVRLSGQQVEVVSVSWWIS